MLAAPYADFSHSNFYAFLSFIFLWRPSERTKARWPGQKRFPPLNAHSRDLFFYFVHLCRTHIKSHHAKSLSLDICARVCACWRPIDYWCLPSHNTCVLSVTRVTQSSTRETPLRERIFCLLESEGEKKIKGRTRLRCVGDAGSRGEFWRDPDWQLTLRPFTHTVRVVAAENKDENRKCQSDKENGDLFQSI